MNCVGLAAFGVASFLIAPSATGLDVFNYEFQNVFDVHADDYLVNTRNAEKYGDPPGCGNARDSYWGPVANNTPAVLTYKFDFAAPVKQVVLDAAIFSGRDPRTGESGDSSLWASADGCSWQMLADNSAPMGCGVVWKSVGYDQPLPDSLLLGDSLWLQVRMEDWAPNWCYSDPQDRAFAGFSRAGGLSSGPSVFQLEAVLVPEPAPLAFALLGAAGFIARGIASRHPRH